MYSLSSRYFPIFLSAVFLLAACGKSPDKLILGKWQYESEVVLPSKNDSVRTTRHDIAISEYLANGSNMLARRMVVKSAQADGGVERSLEFAFDVNVSREWLVKDGLVIFKIIDAKSQPVYLKRDGVLVTDPEEKKKFFDGVKKPEDSILKGQSNQIKIISFEKDKFVYEADISGTGKPELISATRTDKVLRDIVKD